MDAEVTASTFAGSLPIRTTAMAFEFAGNPKSALLFLFIESTGPV
jgi:hypothetical protein